MNTTRRSFLGLLLLLAAAPAGAQTLADYDYENLAFRGVGLDYGYIWPDKVKPTHRFGARFDLGYLGPGLRVIPSIGWWSSTFTPEELDQLATQLRAAGGFVQVQDLEPIEWSDITLAVDGYFAWNTPLHVMTYLGGGVGLHALNGHGPAVDDTFVEDLLDSVTAGVAVLAGIEFEPISRLRVYAEARYTAMNSIRYASVKGGLAFMFPAP